MTSFLTHSHTVQYVSPRLCRVVVTQSYLAQESTCILIHTKKVPPQAPSTHKPYSSPKQTFYLLKNTEVDPKLCSDYVVRPVCGTTTLTQHCKHKIKKKNFKWTSSEVELLLSVTLKILYSLQCNEDEQTTTCICLPTETKRNIKYVTNGAVQVTTIWEMYLYKNKRKFVE